MQTESRAPTAVILTAAGPLLALLIWALSRYSLDSLAPTDVLYGLVLPVLPFLVLAFSVRSRRRDGSWRYRKSEIRTLSLIVAALISLPHVWLYLEYGLGNGRGVNIALGCFFVLVPILLPFILILGLALAAESSLQQAPAEDDPRQTSSAS